MITIEDVRRMLSDEIGYHESRIDAQQRDGARDRRDLTRHEQRLKELRAWEGEL